jgi:hypothetical protein
MVRQQAERLVPTAAVGLAPHGTSLVNIETVMWADAPRNQTLPAVSILGRSVSIRLTLAGVSWDFGDGELDSSGPAGRPYDNTADPCRSRQCPQYFGHTYRHTGKVRVRATASWTASFTVDGGAPVDIPGAVTGPQSDEPLVIKQARAVLVPNPGEH